MHDLLVMFATVAVSLAVGFGIGRAVDNHRSFKDTYWRGYGQAVDDIELTLGVRIRPEVADDGESS